MRSIEEVTKRLADYSGAHLLYDDEGYISWQCSTGENVEILFIEVAKPRNGVGKRLIRDMCNKIEPYNSVFVFRKASNEPAGHFYRSLGFRETHIDGLYTDGAVLGVVNFQELKRNVNG